MGQSDLRDSFHIAVVGMCGRFPGAHDLDDFWRNLRDGVESISFFSDQELAASGVDPSLIHDPNYVKARGILGDADLFDATFFGHSPKVAELMDPQHRVFLECAWEALEGAGYDSERYEGRIGVYAGESMNTYLLNNLYAQIRMVASIDSLQAAIGNDKDSLTTEVSYKLHLRGPSVTIQSSSSTSLVAIHQACQSLINYECDMALAGGVSIHIPEKAGYLYQEGGTTSRDGHCRAFDARAQGFVSGHGVGIVVLKRLEEALADGDHIRAVIRGSAVNNDGATKVSYMAPSVDGQADVIALAQVLAGVTADSIGYVEAHGTGTALGDLIEIAALTQAFRTTTQRNGFCALGSVKTNIGHLDAAAGVAGLIKAILALEYGRIPPTLHFQTPNPQIDFASSPFYVNTELSEWPLDDAPRRAGVSSFGMGGTNAHVVLEEAPVVEAADAARPWHLLLLSARTRPALDAATRNLAAHLKRTPGANLADVAYTLQVGRRTFAQRRMLVCRDHADAIALLEAPDSERVFSAVQERRDRPVAFMFSGQGTQYAGMAADLYRDEPVFRRSVDRCAELLGPHLGRDIRELIFDEGRRTKDEGSAAVDHRLETMDDGRWTMDDGPDLSSIVYRLLSDSGRDLEQTWLAQPVLFVVEYALARLWMAWGVKPAALIGHSIGEYVAACLAGVFTLEDALALVAARGRLMQQLPEGAMLAVPLPEHELRPLLGEQLALAAVNGPAMCVASGEPFAITALHSRLAERGLDCRRLRTSHAFHSAMIDPIVEPFAELVGRVELQPPSIPYISNLTGDWITAAQATDPRYWARHLREPVRFADGLAALAKNSDYALLEVGPGYTLSGLAKLCIEDVRAQPVLSSLRHPRDPQPDAALLLATVGRLWLAGVAIDWAGFYVHERRRRVPLPTYPFERRRYWVEPARQANLASAQPGADQRRDLADWFYAPSWKRANLPQPVHASVATEQARGWLVYVDACGLGADLARRLERAGHAVTRVLIGERFAAREGVYTVDPRRREDYGALFAELRAANTFPQIIIHCWSVTPADHAQNGGEALENSHDLGLYSLIFLAQALGEHEQAEALRIYVVSSQIQQVESMDGVVPEKAMILGPCRVIPSEYPHIACHSIDIAIPRSQTFEQAGVVDQILAEVAAASADSVVAYRGHHRWLPLLEPVRLEEPPDSFGRLRRGGTYLITGGLGGIGLALGAYLARTLGASVALLDRAALPEPADWEDWLAAHPAEDAISGTIRQLRALAEAGAQVLVVNADVTSRAELAAALRQVDTRFGALHGVIHAAGVAGGGVIQLKTPELMEPVLAPKVAGARALMAALGERKLDFLALCSSLDSLVGVPGQVDECAASAFFDALAQAQAAERGSFTISINWAPWHEVGQAARMDVRAGLGAWQDEILRNAIRPGEGAEAFGRIVGSRLPQVVVSPRDVQAVIARFGELIAGQPRQSEPVHAKDLAARPIVASAYIAPADETERMIVEVWQEALGIEPIGVQDNFFDLGGNSLTGIKVISRLKEALNTDFSISNLFETPTVRALASAITAGPAAPEQDEERIMELLSMIEQLPEDEVKTLLAQKKSPPAI